MPASRGMRKEGRRNFLKAMRFFVALFCARAEMQHSESVFLQPSWKKWRKKGEGMKNFPLKNLLVATTTRPKSLPSSLMMHLLLAPRRSTYPLSSLMLVAGKYGSALWKRNYQRYVSAASIDDKFFSLPSKEELWELGSFTVFRKETNLMELR